MISTSDFRKGLKIEFKKEPYEIVDFQHVKIGRGGAIVRTKMKSIRTGNIIEHTFRSGDKVDKPQFEERNMQYLYTQDGMYYFMDNETYEQIPLTIEQLGDSKKFLKENMVVAISYYNKVPISVELPIFVELVVKETDPAGFKGDTASGGSKPAELETGAIIKVPLHINEGDTVKIDTRTEEYIERVK